MTTAHADPLALLLVFVVVLVFAVAVLFGHSGKSDEDAEIQKAIAFLSKPRKGPGGTWTWWEARAVTSMVDPLTEHRDAKIVDPMQPSAARKQA